MKQLFIAGLLALTALSSCEWIGGEEELTHDEIIHQMITDTIAYLTQEDNLFSVMFINPDGSFQTRFEDYPFQDDGFATELEVYPSDDTLAVEWQFYHDFNLNSTRHYFLPYSFIDSVNVMWYICGHGEGNLYVNEIPEGWTSKGESLMIYLSTFYKVKDNMIVEYYK